MGLSKFNGSFMKKFSFAIFLIAIVMVLPSHRVLSQTFFNAQGIRSHLERFFVNFARLARMSEAIDQVIVNAIERKHIPGAVVIVGQHGKVVYRKAFGNRVLKPQKIAMTLDTVFDLSSLTKVIATAMSILILSEKEFINLQDPVSQYLPEFGQRNKGKITIEQLLRHRGGVIADIPISQYNSGYQTVLKHIFDLPLKYPPDTKFLYSDVGYIVLSELVQHVTGRRIDQFAHEHIFEPLKMEDTMFTPINDLQQRAAPTEKRNGKWLTGVVHDPRAYLLNGVAGHAGLFSTGDDLAIFCQMILNGGQMNGIPILGEEKVQEMTKVPNLPSGQIRALGWDIDTPFSGPRGQVFPIGSIGHSGFTGTSLWLNPESDTFVIILTNRLHPNGNGDVRKLRRAIATIVGESTLN